MCCRFCKPQVVIKSAKLTGRLWAPYHSSNLAETDPEARGVTEYTAWPYTRCLSVTKAAFYVMETFPHYGYFGRVNYLAEYTMGIHQSCGRFRLQKSVMRSYDVFFAIHFNNLLTSNLYASDFRRHFADVISL